MPRAAVLLMRFLGEQPHRARGHVETSRSVGVLFEGLFVAGS